MTWLLTPLSGASMHAIPAWTAWHARMMVLAWTILLPAGMFVARFCKIHPRQDWPTSLDSKFWWRTHVATQIAGIVVMTLGLALAWGQGASATGPARLHHLLGWSIAALGRRPPTESRTLVKRLGPGRPRVPRPPALGNPHWPDWAARELAGSCEWLAALQPKPARPKFSPIRENRS